MNIAYEVAQFIQSIATTVGICIAGLWALRQYILQREYLWNIDIECEQELLPYSTDRQVLVINIGLKNIGKQVFVPGPNGLELTVKRFPLTLNPGEYLDWNIAETFIETTDILEHYLSPEDVASGKKDYKRGDGYCLDVGATYRESPSVIVEKGYVYLIELTLWDGAEVGDSMTEYHVVSFV